MTTVQTINVFFSSDDQKIFPSITAVLRQLRLLAVTWITSNGCEIALKLHDTAAEDFDLTPAMVEQICSQNETVLTLVAPCVLLGPGMLTSAPWQQLMAASAANTILMLGIYCEKVTNTDRLVRLLGNRNWFATNNLLHLSAGKCVNDEAADVATNLCRVLEKRFNS